MSVAGLIATGLLPAGRAPNPVQLVWTKWASNCQEQRNSQSPVIFLLVSLPMAHSLLLPEKGSCATLLSLMWLMHSLGASTHISIK
jgi:hypothetical protein